MKFFIFTTQHSRGELYYHGVTKHRGGWPVMDKVSDKFSERLIHLASCGFGISPQMFESIPLTLQVSMALNIILT